MEITTEQKQWLESVQNKNIYELCQEDTFKVKLPYDNKRGPVRDAYNAEDSRLDALFWLKLEEDECPSYLSDKVKLAIRSKAWEEGHSCGYHEVANVYSDWVELATTVWDEAVAFVKGRK